MIRPARSTVSMANAPSAKLLFAAVFGLHGCDEVVVALDQLVENLAKRLHDVRLYLVGIDKRQSRLDNRLRQHGSYVRRAVCRHLICAIHTLFPPSHYAALKTDQVVQCKHGAARS